MKSPIADVSIRKAAILVGISILIMAPLAMFADGVALQSLIVSGDAATTANNIKADEVLFGLSIVSYIIILVLDVIIALALYVILKPVNKTLASLAASLRLIYAAIMGISLFALVLLYSNEYTYGKLIAYIFFITHLFVLGYVVYTSGYIPRPLGILLMIASFSYIILLYGKYFLPTEWLQILTIIVILPSILAELLLGIWLLVKRNKLNSIRNIDNSV